MRKNKLKYVGVLLFATFMLQALCLGFASAQTDEFVGEEEVLVETENENSDIEPEIDMRIEEEQPASEAKVQEESYMEIQQQESSDTEQNNKTVQAISTAPEEAPDAGPAESVIIIAAITFGFLGAIIFLALVVHNRY